VAGPNIGMESLKVGKEVLPRHKIGKRAKVDISLIVQ
jgi:hypothetical protein